ncbi:MAG: methylamine dehydrogenase light chain [Gemmatimonadales bacterium]|nr:methylamine dehydrogenase light chain [Gemmatimonadales bacterium]
MARSDDLVEAFTRRLAKTVSRRSVLRALGGFLVGAAAVPVLPVKRGHATAGGPDDETSCDYWRYCAMDGFICACCGGTARACPPGTEAAPITWVGTCRNASDGRDYIVSYNDCCGKSSCGRCLCNRNEGDRPLYLPANANDYNWCVGSKSGAPYHCTISRIMGVATK